jgi:Fe-S-cluster formation regulator IscX/YfhJ
VACWTAVTALALGVTPPARGPLVPVPVPQAGSVQSGGLFDSDAPLQLRIAVDLKSLVNDRDSVKAEDHPAVLTYQVGDAPPVSVDVKLKTRGHWRRQKQNCDFPPLRLDFPGSKVDGTIFANQDKLKLATPCRPRRREYEEYILREHLVYKVYNLLTPLSLRTRLVRTTYVDATGRMDSLTTHTFLIEDAEQMAARNGGELLEVRGARFAEMDSLQLGRMGVFLYMIGGTDWSLRGLHNIGMVREPEGSVYPFAYDFDWTGIVSTEYARPDSRLPIRTVRQRLYRGGCLTEEQWKAVLGLFWEQRAAIAALYDAQADLTPRYVRDTHRYLDDFYEVIDDPGKVSKELIRRCWPEEGI